jgi:hypothetical protein
MKKTFFSSLQCTVLILALLSGCSEFNRPVALDTYFTWNARDSISDSRIELIGNGEYVRIYFGWYDFDSMNAKFFLKERKENEFITAPLSSLPIDIGADICIQEESKESDKIFVDVNYYDKNGEKVGRSDSSHNYKSEGINMTIENLAATSHIQVYFWQFEFYVYGDTVRLPEKPGVWCIKPDWRIVGN